MERTQAIGLALIFAVAYLFLVYNSPSEEEIAANKRRQDSLNLVEQQKASQQAEADIENITEELVDSSAASDTTQKIIQEEQLFTLENDQIKVEFTNKGGRISSATLKEYQRVIEDEEHNKTYVPLVMMASENNEFDFRIPTDGQSVIRTGKEFLEGKKSGRTVEFSLNKGGVPFRISYTLPDSGFVIETKVSADGITNSSARTDVELNWVNYLHKLELNEGYEKYYTSVYYKESEEDPDYCSCRSDDQVEVDDEAVDWVAHVNQFFNSALIPEKAFTSAKLETVMLEEDPEYLKILKSNVTIPGENFEGSGLTMQLYVGPNDFEILRTFENDLEDVIPFGTSIFGTINRWLIRPLFNFLMSLIGLKGLTILVLTFIVKLVLYPLTYKMLYSQAKMAALKPEIEKVKEKNKDDSQKVQVETMKLYREFGVNPLGGCMPMVLQMPIWFALYRFFPASIEFRQAPFLWADDLSSYDVIAYLPTAIPMFGEHISLFTILWAGTTVLYTWYNSKLVDMSANPAMKYMQYFMPIMFLFFFNNYASGLTAYLFFSNIFNIGQTMVTKDFILDHDKIKAELNAHKQKPKKKGRFQERLEQAMKEQQRAKAQQNKKKK